MAFEAIPRTLAQNCGVNVIRTMTALQGKVASLRHTSINTVWQPSVISLHYTTFCSMQMVKMHGLVLMAAQVLSQT